MIYWLLMNKSAAVKHFGSAKKLADALGITRQAIHAWGPEIPDLWQYKIHHLSGGELPLDSRLDYVKPQAERRA